MKYEYSNNRYENTGPLTISEALYHKAYSPLDYGNPYIEALPYPINQDDIDELIKHYSRLLPEYDYKEKELDRNIRIKRISQIRHIRVFLPFEQILEEQFNEALIQSYRLRKPVLFNDGKEDYYKLMGDICDSANSAFALIGYSGSGKSSAMKMLLERYPQVIYHTINDSKVPQIVYISVPCASNSNFNALYSSIAEAIDNALRTHIYQNKVDKIRGLGNKTNYINQLIELFGIGAIILDEIQNIDFDNTKENTYESLLTIVNKTKVAICVIGTEDAYEKMFNKVRTARRIGVIIESNSYCKDKLYFTHIIQEIWKYQWFDSYQELTNEIIDVFYEETKGLIDQVISLYKAIHYDYLVNGVKHITPSFIKKVSKKYFSNLKELLENQDDNQKEIERRLRKNRAEIEAKIMNADQEFVKKAIISNKANIDTTNIIQEVVYLIQKCTDSYTPAEIETICIKIIEKSSPPYDATAIFRKTLNILTKKPRSHIKNAKDIFDSLVNDQ